MYYNSRGIRMPSSVPRIPRGSRRLLRRTRPIPRGPVRRRRRVLRRT